MPQLKSHLSEKLTMPLLSLKLISMEDVNKNADRLILKSVTVKKIPDTVIKHYCVWYLFNCNSLYFWAESRKICMGVFFSHFVLLLSIFPSKIMEEWNNQLYEVWFLQAKGQLISECPYEIIVCPKIATKKFLKFLP